MKVVFDHLTKEFEAKRNVPGTVAVNDFCFEIPDGKLVGLLGPSGCGKSTLLKCVAGLIPDYEGRVLINGEEVNPKAQTIGFMPQNYGLLPWKTVRENILLGCRMK